MSIINYEKMFKTTDARIVKTRQSIFRAIIQLMSEQDLSMVTITALCKTAVINRKTFYIHYKSIIDALDDLEYQIVLGFIDRLTASRIITYDSFDPHAYMMLIHELVESDRADFDVLFPLLKTGSFMRKMGAELGKLAFRLMHERPKHWDNQSYAFALVFTLSGLMTSYIDWLDFGRQIPLSELADVSKYALDIPLTSILVPNAETGKPG